MRLLVTGGYFDDSGECFVDRLDPGRGTRERLLSFVPPAPHRIPGKGFTGAAWLDADTFLVCSFDAVWRFTPATGRCTGRLHQADFNDLHGLAVDHTAVQLHICNTGLDSIETFDLHGRFLGRAAMTPAWFEAARQQGNAVARDDFDRVLVAGWQQAPRPAPPLKAPGGDYYDRPGDEPFHRSKVRDYMHPNSVVVWGEHLVATVLASSELRCLRTHRTLARVAAPPHDGLSVGDDLWLTTVDGRIWRIARSGDVALVFDTAATGRLGWCRGLAIDVDAIAVGLTAIRTAPKYVWRTECYERTETGVLWLDRASGRLRAWVGYDDSSRHAKLFALLPARGAWA
ncbi:MAG TPA: hypothetical protein VH165_07440 [Kofleriaceae bacterium]|nr:hypothetical protein [Kofleriaceae bacterium]